MTKFHLISLGCPKNLVDSEVMLGRLLGSGYCSVDDPAKAEVIIINTCSFVHDAKDESVSTILQMSEYKQTGRCKRLVVTGCLAQRYHEELEKELPEVDLFVGTGEYHRIAELLAEPDSRSYVDNITFIHGAADRPVHTGPSYLGYLKISEGCNRRCSFCIIPELRGPVRSRSITSLVKETRALARAGVRELSLIAQDLTEYGRDFVKAGKNEQTLEKLLHELCGVRGIDWIRLHYVYPDDFSNELVNVIANESKIVKYLDLPIQHTNDRILKLMNRKARKAKIFALVKKLRERIPGIVLRASIIVGFPGETRAEFDELCDDLKTLALDRVGVFAYSREEGTKAAELPEQVPAAEKRRRERSLVKLLDGISLGIQKQYLGRKVDVLVEGSSEETEHLIQGRMAGQAAGGIDGHVLINDLGDFPAAKIKPGVIVPVEITEVLPHDLIGRVI